ncbi:MAG: hypothetical protein M5U34_08000 [Chloroflexi bacterium]|nr:hypothetical protein [Chloroflexota bacterium]
MEDETVNYFLAFIMVFGLLLGCGAVTFVCFFLDGDFGGYRWADKTSFQ